jgi:hypothetical protein
MRKNSFNLRRAASLALLACSLIGLGERRAAAQTFDTVLNTNLFQPSSVSVTPLNHYIISDTADHRIVDFNADNRNFVVLAGPDRAPFEPGAVDGQGADARFRNPQGILCAGDLTYVADSGNHVIRAVDKNGNVQTIAGNLAVAHEVDDFGGSPMNWGFTDGVGANAQFNGPSGLAWDGANQLFIADSGNRAVRVLDLTSGTVSTVVRSGLTTPVAVARGKNGTLFIADSGAHTIKVWHPGDTKATLLAGGGSPLARGFRNSAIATNALFSAPAGIYYREVTDELIVADSGNSVLRTVQGVSGSAPRVDTFANTTAAGLQSPVAIARDLYGVFLVCDPTRNALSSVLTVRLPRIERPQVGYIDIYIDQQTGLPVAHLIPVTDSTFENNVRIAVSGDASAQHYFTVGAALTNTPNLEIPTTNSTSAPNFIQPVEPAPSESILNSESINGIYLSKYTFHLKVFSAPKGDDERIASLVTESYFRFKCASPQIDSQSVPGRLLFHCNTTNAVMYYTMDGSDPIQGSSTAQIIKNNDSIPLVVSGSNITVRARAYLNDRFLPSETTQVTFTPDNFTPNRISLGFADGEASSLMRAAPGQRYFAPITLSLMPGAKAYGLQFELSLEPLGTPLTNDYKMRFNSTFIEQTDFTNRIIPPSVFVLSGTNYFTNFNTIATNYTYAVTFTNISTLPSTNYVAFTNVLPTVVPVVTTTFVTNLGTFFPISTTNYVTNSFQLVSKETVTNASDIVTNYLYRYIAPSVTNLVRVDSELPATSPIVVTNFVSNLGQLYSYNSTNYITNAFSLVSKGANIDASATVVTNHLYALVNPARTNIIQTDHKVDEGTVVITTNFVSNLGLQFPVLTTNYITNSFDLVSRDVVSLVTITTNFDYRAVQPGTTNFITVNALLPDTTPVVLTNFVTNMGVLYPLVSTNYISNSFDLLSWSVETNRILGTVTNYLYQVSTSGQTNVIVVDHRLLDRAPIVTTNLVSNLGQQFPVLTTNYVSNSYDLFAEDLVTNVDTAIRTNFAYRAVTPGQTTVLTLNTLLQPTVTVITTNFVSNLGQQFPVAQTNVLTNAFELLSSSISNHVVSTVSTSFVYRSISAATNYITLDHFFPDYGPVETFISATNQGKFYTLSSTNLATNAFELVAAEIKTNVVSQLRYEYIYDGIPWTNYLQWPAPLPLSATVITTNNLIVTNLAGGPPLTFPLVTASSVTDAIGPALVLNTDEVQYGYFITNYFPGSSLISSNPLSFPTSIAIQATGVIPELNETFTEQFVTIVPITILSTNTNTVVFTQITTNATYRLRSPLQTNYITLSTNLPDIAPVVAFVTVTNQGQNFTMSFTNYASNVFDLVSTTFNTSFVTNVLTNAVYALHTPPVTNIVNLSTNLPDSAQIVTTSFVTNLGQLFPVTTTNIVANTFDFLGETIVTNTLRRTVSTNVTYVLVDPPVTNYVFWPELLPGTKTVLTTNFISNLGQQFPVIATNVLTNIFGLVGSTVQTNYAPGVTTNALYALVVPSVTNYLSLTNRLLNFAPVVTTIFLTNQGQVFPLSSTNFEANAFEFLGERHVTNSDSNVRTNFTYVLVDRALTNYILWPELLQPSVTVVVTNFVGNLGQQFPVLTTNVLANQFQLLSTYIATNFVYTTNILYEFHSPAITNLFELDDKLPTFVQVISTNFVTNLGRLFPVLSTNTIANLFDLISTNVTATPTTNYVYAVLVPGGGATGDFTVTTNLLTTPSELPQVVPVVSFVGFATNLTQVYSVFSTNYVTNTFKLVTTSLVTNIGAIRTTDVADAFTDLVITNYSQNWLAVGWVETYGRTNLYNTIQHDLLNLSMPHTTTFVGKNGEAVPGSFSFIIPTTAVTGDQFKVSVSRPSATADGISQDMFIQAPDETDTKSPVKAVRTLTVTNHLGYVVGDVSDFHWFNAGEFGDGNLLNNDITELQRVIVYGLNVPPEDSDFLDAMDTCCYTEDGTDLSNIEFASSSIDLNRIAFGEGSRFAPLGRRPNVTLAVNDLYVAFRRSLESDLNWYQRYWSNGMRQASIVPNSYRGKAGVSSLPRIKSYAVPAGPSIQSTDAPALTLYAGTVSGMPGAVVAVPIHARVDGGYALRTLMFNARVVGADGTAVPSSSLEVAATDGLGMPTVLLNDQPGLSGAAWLDSSTAGVLGDRVVGRVLFTIPSDAKPMNLYYVKLDRVSGSPNGVSLFPVRSGNGVVAMANRPASGWNDGIPDAWRLQYFGTLNDARSAADADADGDGLSNYEEYKLGTNPMDPTDSLRVHAAANGRGVKLSFHTANGKMYQIEGSNTLQPGSWTTVQNNVPGTGNDIELPTPGGQHSFYYRVRLQE